jgi:hypothetical protein
MPEPARLGLPWTPEEAAAVLGPRGDADLLRDLVVRVLGLPEVEPGRWDAADLLGLHDALLPWLPRRRLRPEVLTLEEAAA